MRPLLLALLLPLAAFAAEDSNIACVKALTIPEYPHIAKQARVAGRIEARFQVTETGRADRVRLELLAGIANARGMLGTAVEAKLRAAQFDPACARKTVILEFLFELREDLPLNGASTEFQAPNRFVTATGPVPINF